MERAILVGVDEVQAAASRMAAAARKYALEYMRADPGPPKILMPERTGDKGQRFEVRAVDANGKEFVIGWCNDPEATIYLKMVDVHPSWHAPKIVDRETGEIKEKEEA